jgi:predicted aspartyl protease
MARSWLSFSPGGVPVVSVRIDPDRYYALVDTGASVSFVSPEVVIKLGWPTVGKQNVVAVIGQQESLTTVQLPAIGFGNIELAPCRAAVRHLTQLGLGIELILGVNAFSSRRLQFDFTEGRIYLVQ